MADDKFSVFYAAYPRREARKDAEKAWRQIGGDQYFDAIMAALVWQGPLFLQRERHHRPLPATYLRGERWTDDPPEEQAIVATPYERRQYDMWRYAVGAHASAGVTLEGWVKRQRGQREAS